MTADYIGILMDISFSFGLSDTDFMNLPLDFQNQQSNV